MTFSAFFKSRLGKYVLHRLYFHVSNVVTLTINCSKSTCTDIGLGASHSISDMQLGSSFISWSSSFRYLDITFTGGKKLSVDIDVIKRKFYAACNCIFL